MCPCCMTWIGSEVRGVEVTLVRVQVSEVE